MSHRARTFIVPLLIAGGLASALSVTSALAAGDEQAPPKPKCTSEQFLDPKTHRCKPLVSQRADPAGAFRVETVNGLPA